MLYAIAHFLRDKCPWIWDIIENLNSFLFYFLYGKKLKNIGKILEKYQEDYTIEELKEKDVKSLVLFFKEQPAEAFTYFKPHEFDENTIRKIQTSKSFLAFIVKEKGRIVGYFFLRCYFMGKCFRGYMVDYQHRNLGISKLTAKIMTDITNMIGIPSYGTIAPENISSMKSQNATILKQLENGDYYVKY